MRAGFSIVVALSCLPANVRAAPTTTTSEDTAVERWPNTLRLTVGGAIVSVAYVPGVAYASLEDESPAGMEKSALYIPIAGPLLAIRGVGCDGSGSCSSSRSEATVSWLVLFFDALVQASGGAVVVAGLLSTEEVTAPVIARQPPLIVPRLDVKAEGGYGVSVCASF